MRIEAFKCDKCGSLVMEATTINLLKTDVDLCPHCVQTLFDALNLNPVKEDVREVVKESPIAEPKADVVEKQNMDKRRTIPDKIKERVIEDYRSGMSFNDIDRKYGFYNGRAHYILEHFGAYQKKFKSPKNKLSSEAKDELVSMYAEGIPVKEIAEVYGVSDWMVCKLANDAGLSRKSSRGMVTSNKTKAKELWNDGKSIPEIAEILNKKESSVKKVLDDLFEKGLLTRKYSVVKKPEPMPIPEKEPERRVRTTVDAQGFVTEVVFD